MEKIELVTQDKKWLKDITNILTDWQYHPYRKYPFLNQKDLISIAIEEFKKILSKDTNSVLALSIDSKIKGIACLTYLPWDTKIFCVNMSKISHLIVPVNNNLDERRYVLKKLLESVIEIAFKKQIKFISCRVDTEDKEIVFALENKGFRLMDTILTYIFNTKKHFLPKLKSLFFVRPFKKEDLKEIKELARNSFTKDRFHLDKNIPKQKADTFHIEWVVNYCYGRNKETVLVATKGKEIVGFLGYKQDKLIEEVCGVKIGGKGISAVKPGNSGCYVSLINFLLKKFSMPTLDISEFSTQIDNYPVIKIWQRFGMEYTCSFYTFHKWLGE